MPPEKAIQIIKENAGSQFDPKIAELFCEAFQKGLINKIIQNYEASKKSIECPFCSTNISLSPDMQKDLALVCPICEHEYAVKTTDLGLKAVKIK